MLNRHIDKKSAIPWWAAFGAPLLGVPLLVGLLALSAPGTAGADAAEEVDATFVSDEAGDAKVLPEHVAGLSFDREPSVDARC